MKLISKSLCLAFVLAIVLLFAAVPAVGAEIVVVDPGQTATFSIDYSAVCAIEGSIVFSNPSMISNVKYDIIGSGMNGLVENGTIFLYADKPDGVDGKIDITITVHSTAPKGGSCMVTFRYATTKPGSSVPGPEQSVMHTVTVRTEAAIPPTEPTNPPVDESTQPEIIYADTSALRKQIQIAQNLTYYDYTKESWQTVTQALKNAQNQLSSTSQTDVDKATKNLKVALENLVLMDYTALQEALNSAGEMGKNEAIAALWSRFVSALENARIQRISGDQSAVDAATEELLASKDELQKALQDMGELVVVEKEVEVEVEPSYTYCNNAAHTVTRVLMIVSLAMNLFLITLILIYFYKRYMNKRDNTPLVEYDISDDLGEINEDFLE